MGSAFSAAWFLLPAEPHPGRTGCFHRTGLMSAPFEESWSCRPGPWLLFPLQDTCCPATPLCLENSPGLITGVVTLNLCMFSNITASSLQMLLGKVLQDGECAHLSKNMSVEDSQIPDEQGKQDIPEMLTYKKKGRFRSFSPDDLSAPDYTFMPRVCILSFFPLTQDKERDWPPSKKEEWNCFSGFNKECKT